MKNKKTILLLLIALIGTSTLHVNAMPSVSSSFSGNQNVTVGSGRSVTLNLKGLNNKPSSFIVHLRSSDTSVISLNTNNISHDRGGAVTVSFNALKAGKATIEIYSDQKGKESAGSTLDTFEEFFVTGRYEITVSSPSSGGGGTTTTPPPTKPNPGGGGGSTPPVKDDTENEKAGITQTPEQKAKAEEERAKVELEALKKVPLVKEMSIISEAVKMQGDLLSTIQFVDNSFDYSYSLPRKIDKVSISVPPVEGVNLTYDKTLEFAEGEESKVLEIKASKGEVEQVFNITIVQDTTPDVLRTVGKDELIVYQDERITEYFATYGFETSVSETEGVGNYFENEHIKFQLLVDDKNAGTFFLLGDDHSIIEPIAIVDNQGEKLSIVETKNEILQATLYGEKPVVATHEAVISMENVDPTLELDPKIPYWDIDEGAVFYGMSDDGVKGTYLISNDKIVSKAIVAFDKPNPQQDKLVTMLSVALIALASTNVVYLVIRFTRQRKYQ